MTGYGEVLQLATINRIGNHTDLTAFEKLPLRLVLRRNGEAQEHRYRRLPLRGRMAAPVLQVTALTGARVEQRAQTVGGLG